MKSRVLGVLAMATILAISSRAYATAYQGYVKNVYAYGSKIYVIVGNGWFDGSTGPCPLPGSMMGFAIDPATDIGKAQLAIALSAKTTGILVWAAGNGACEGGPGANVEPLVALDLKG